VLSDFQDSDPKPAELRDTECHPSPVDLILIGIVMRGVEAFLSPPTPEQLERYFAGSAD